jgi:hypothetical protein
MAGPRYVEARFHLPLGRGLAKMALQRGSTGRNRGSTGPLERVDRIFARSTGPIRDRPLSQLVENDLG